MTTVVAFTSISLAPSLHECVWVDGGIRRTRSSFYKLRRTNLLLQTARCVRRHDTLHKVRHRTPRTAEFVGIRCIQLVLQDAFSLVRMNIYDQAPNSVSP